MAKMLKIEDLQGISQEDFEKMYQEDTNKFIGERISRNTEKVTKEIEAKFNGYLSPDEHSSKLKELQDKYKDYDTNMAQKETEINSLKLSALKTKTAIEKGLPFEMASRLVGEDEESIKKDAEKMAKLFGSKQPPKRNNDPYNGSDAHKESYRSLLKGLKE